MQSLKFNKMAHKELVQNLIEKKYLKTLKIIKAFKKIDRANFVKEDYQEEAYVDAPLPIGFGQTISQPLTVAFMIELLEPKNGDKILDIGSGSGWQTAILAEIVGKKGKIFAIERVQKLKEFGEGNVEKHKFISDGRVEFIQGDGSLGLSDKAPFDKIIAAASADSIPQAWKNQLKIGGRIVAPVKTSVKLLIKKSEKEFEEFDYAGFSFVPLIEGEKNGEQQWRKYFKKPGENS